MGPPVMCGPDDTVEDVSHDADIWWHSIADGYTCIGTDYSDVLGGVGEKREGYDFRDHLPPCYRTEENAKSICTCSALGFCQLSGNLFSATSSTNAAEGQQQITNTAQTGITGRPSRKYDCRAANCCIDSKFRYTHCLSSSYPLVHLQPNISYGRRYNPTCPTSTRSDILFAFAGMLIDKRESQSPATGVWLSGLPVSPCRRWTDPRKKMSVDVREEHRRRRRK